jgi:hypothetical protein
VDAERLEELAAEHARLKRELAEQIFESDVIKDVLRRKLEGIGETRAIADDRRRQPRIPGSPRY